MSVSLEEGILMLFSDSSYSYLIHLEPSFTGGCSPHQPGIAGGRQQNCGVAPSSLLPHVSICFAGAFNSCQQSFSSGLLRY